MLGCLICLIVFNFAIIFICWNTRDYATTFQESIDNLIEVVNAQANVIDAQTNVINSHADDIKSIRDNLVAFEKHYNKLIDNYNYDSELLEANTDLIIEIGNILKDGAEEDNNIQFLDSFNDTLKLHLGFEDSSEECADNN